MDLPRGLGDDTGETLVEALVAIVILGLAAVAILAGVQLSSTASDIQRKQTTGGAYVRSYAEAIEKYVDAASANYKPCAGVDAYNVAAVTSQLALPAGFTATHAAAVPLDPTGGEVGCANDKGVQKVVLTVRSSDSRGSETLTVILRSTCSTGATC